MGITREQALDCFADDDLIGIGMEADAVRRRLHPDGVVSYTLDGKIDYTQAAAAADLHGDAFQTLCDRIADTIAMGGTSVTLYGEAAPTPAIAWFESLLHSIKNRFPGLWLHGLSATEILAISQSSGLSLKDTIARLHVAGLDSIAGNDAGILDDAVQAPGLRTNCS